VADTPENPAAKRPSIKINDHTLYLNGTGRYKRYYFSLYEVSLYLEHPSKDANEILNSSQVKYAKMVFLRNLTAKLIRGAWRRDFNSQCALNCDKLLPQLSMVLGRIPNMKAGEYFEFTYLPNEWIISKPGLEPIHVTGSELGRVQLSAWIGTSPPTETFKNNLLGRTNVKNR
jgi:hypothetical protein